MYIISFAVLAIIASSFLKPDQKLKPTETFTQKEIKTL